MKTKLWLSAVLGTLLLAACSTGMMLDDSLKTGAREYAVKGRQGWLVNQKLSFGPYQSGKVNRGWTKSYDIPFVARFQGASEKLAFSLKDAGHAELASEVFSLGRITRKELQVLGEFFSIPLQNEDVFSASIHLPQSRETWDLIVYDPNKTQLGSVSTGFLQNGAEKIEIREVERTSQDSKNLGNLVLGYNFVADGKVVGAVETLNNGRFWVRTDLSPKKSFVLANAAAALLLKSGIGEQVE